MSKKKANLFGNIQLTISKRDTLITIVILVAVSLLCFLLNPISESDSYLNMLFMMAVFLISRFTDGYFYGLVSSVLSVICVNYIFTYPYFAFNFTLSGYPLTFICMLTTSFITSMMTTQLKKSEKIKAEISAEKLRSNLLRAVSHDLRTPLTSISGVIQTVIENQDTLTASEQASLLSEAKDDAQWLIRVVENLLSITKITSSPAEIKKTPEAAEEVIGEAASKFVRRFPNIKLTVSVPDELLFIPMDPLLIEQVLENLMENSVLHGKTTSHIEISVQRLGNYAVFSVKDDGIGISDEVKPHLFDGRASGHSSSEYADSKKNMGIGLSVCMSIVRAHGGEMTASDLPSGGADFHFTLPLEENKSYEQ